MKKKTTWYPNEQERDSNFLRLNTGPLIRAIEFKSNEKRYHAKHPYYKVLHQIALQQDERLTDELRASRLKLSFQPTQVYQRLLVSMTKKTQPSPMDMLSADLRDNISNINYI